MAKNKTTPKQPVAKGTGTRTGFDFTCGRLFFVRTLTGVRDDTAHRAEANWCAEGNPQGQAGTEAAGDAIARRADPETRAAAEAAAAVGTNNDEGRPGGIEAAQSRAGGPL